MKKGVARMDKLEIDRIRDAVRSNLNKDAMLTVQKGRNKRVTLPVTIESAHPNIFTVKVDPAAVKELPSTPRRFSFQYVDVLTNSVELVFDKEMVEV
ncbi:MAG: hypothetical protein FWE47_03880 [Oscillospiraceae bacterium]|nr:hypothetical protein [Oscillospiraceae bacterium]